MQGPVYCSREGCRPDQRYLALLRQALVSGIGETGWFRCSKLDMKLESSKVMLEVHYQSKHSVSWTSVHLLPNLSRLGFHLLGVKCWRSQDLLTVSNDIVLEPERGTTIFEYEPSRRNSSPFLFIIYRFTFYLESWLDSMISSQLEARY